MSAQPLREDKRSLDDRLDFLGLDPASLERVKALSPLVKPHIDAALSSFYDKVAKTPEVSHFFSSREHMKNAQAKQNLHWSAIAAGQLDDNYYQSSLRIGNRHAKIGLEPQWYIGGYGLIMETVLKGVIADWMASEVAQMRKRKPEQTMAAANAMAAGLSDLIKAVMLDIDLAVTTYFDKLQGEVEANREKAENMATAQQSVLAVTGQALGQLAQGELHVRIDDDFSGDFAQLKHDFNQAASSLDQAITQIRKSVITIGKSASEVAGAADDLSDRMTRQASAIEQSSAALDEVTNNVNDTASGTGQAAEIANGANAAAEQGGIVVQQAIEAMERIEQSSSKISNIISVIDEIAFQTNLLALNAAVEAARAGEAGRGFAVVATEVRSLAQRSAQAAKDVSNLIKQSGSEVENGVGMVEKTGEALSNIVGQVGQISEHMRNFSTAAGQQATSLNEINAAIVQLDRLTQENAGFVGRSSEAGRDLAQEVADLHKRLDAFRTCA